MCNDRVLQGSWNYQPPSPFLSATRDASTDFKSTAANSCAGEHFTAEEQSAFSLISVILLLLIVTLAGSACGNNKLKKPKEGIILLCFSALKVISGLPLSSQGRPMHPTSAEVAQCLPWMRQRTWVVAQRGHPLARCHGEVTPTFSNQS